MQAFLLLALTVAPQDAASTERYDIRPILAAGVEDDFHAWLRPVLQSIDEIYPDSEQGVIARSEMSTTSGAIEGALHDAVLMEPGAVEAIIEGKGGLLEITTNRAGHVAVERTLTAMRAHHHAEIVVEAYRIQRDRLPAAGRAILTRAEADRLGSDALDLPRTIALTRWGRLQRVSHESLAQYLQDYDVEVAQFAALVDPTVNRVHLGLGLQVRVDRSASGGGIIARVWGGNARLAGDHREHVIDAYGGAAIEQPLVEASRFTASGVVEPGGALVVDSGHPDGRALVVRFHADVEPRRDDDPTVDFGAFGVPFLREGPLGPSIVVPSRGLDQREDLLLLHTAPWIQYRSEVEELVGLIDDDETIHVPVRIGASAIVATSNAKRKELREAIEARRARVHARTVEFTFVTFAAEPADLNQALVDPSRLAALCDAAPARRIGSVFSYDTLQLMGGTVSSHLMDTDIQVAQAAVAADPIVKSLFDGTRLWCAPVEATPDGISVWVDVALQTGAGDIRIVDTFITSPKLMGFPSEKLDELLRELVLRIPLQLTRTRPVAARAHLTLAPGRWKIVTAQPFDGDERVQVICVKARLADD